MTSKSFTLGIYEDRRVYFWLIAEAARAFVSNGTLDEVFIVWYWLNQTLADWTQTVEGEEETNPFGERPYLIHLTKDNYTLPGEKSPGQIIAGALDWEGQKDMPENLKAELRTPGKFSIVRNIVECPRPNIIVIDHELFRRDTAEAVLPEGCAHLIKKGLQSYYGGSANTPPLFLSSLKPLAGVTGLDTVGIGRGGGPGARWFPRPEEKRPKKLPEGFEQELHEEVLFWLRNRDLLGAKYDRSRWPSYSPPIDHALVCDQSDLKLDLESPEQVVFRRNELSVELPSDVLLASHCKAYLEIRNIVRQEDLHRLSKIAEKLPLPVVLLYWNTSPSVGNLADSGVLAHLVTASERELKKETEKFANDWIQKMAALDTVVGGKQLMEIRDDLLRWRLAGGAHAGAAHIRHHDGRALLITGSTGAGKTAVSKWGHFFSNHIIKDEQDINALWEDIPVPASKKGVAARLGNIHDKGTATTQDKGSGANKGTDESKSTVDVVKFWAKKLIEHGGAIPPRGANLKKLLQTAFETSGRRPWQVNLVGVTREDEFVMQIAGAYPAWTGNVGVTDWRPGAVLSATNNSLILNEVGELDSKAQGLLLELIERGGPIRPMFAPIDGEITAKNVLFIMATDRVDRIREQLLYRCRVIQVPSLQACQDDVPELARHRLLPRWCCLSEVAERLLRDWPYWPGNHRSLHGVLDFASERLPSNRRVIRVTDVIRALWRENLFRIPTRLEVLIKWILEWEELDAEPLENVIPAVAERLSNIVKADKNGLDRFNRIADLTFTRPSAHFSDLLHTKTAEELGGEPKALLLRILRLYVHEIFWVMEKRASRMKGLLSAASPDGAKKSKKEDNKFADVTSDLEERLTTSLQEDTLVTLSLGTLIWKVLHVEPKDIAEANTLIRNRPKKASGNRPKTDTNELRTTEQSSKAEAQTKGRGQVPKFDDSRISTTARFAAQYALAVIKALDGRTARGLFDYSEDRRTRSYFGQGLDTDDEDDDGQNHDV